MTVLLVGQEIDGSCSPHRVKTVTRLWWPSAQIRR
jgi:hypothetical protein